MGGIRGDGNMTRGRRARDRRPSKRRGPEGWVKEPEDATKGRKSNLSFVGHTAVVLLRVACGLNSSRTDAYLFC